MNQSFILFNAAVSSRPHYALGPTRRQSVRPSVRPTVSPMLTVNSKMENCTTFEL